MLNGNFGNLEILEESLRQTRKAENRLIESRKTIKVKIEELNKEYQNLGSEIDALGNSAKQTEAAIVNFLEMINKNSGK